MNSSETNPKDNSDRLRDGPGRTPTDADRTRLSQDFGI